MTTYDTASHAKYKITYHIIWCPKFRYDVINPNIEQALKQEITRTSKQYEYEIQALETMPDHVHVLLSAKPTIAPSDIVRTLKSRTAIQLFKQFPELKTFYARCGRLWSRGYYIATVDHTDHETIKRYIDEQKQHS